MYRKAEVSLDSVVQPWSLCHWQEAGASRDTLDSRHLAHAAQSTLVSPHLSDALASAGFRLRIGLTLYLVLQK